MATGMGGTNAHVVLEEAPPQIASTSDPGPAGVAAFSENRERA